MAKRTPASTAPRKRAAAKKPNGAVPAPVTAAPPSADDIRVRAYHRYLERGAREGGDFDDWLEAEKDLKSTRS
jgi:DUF2934 family protein